MTASSEPQDEDEDLGDEEEDDVAPKAATILGAALLATSALKKASWTRGQVGRLTMT